VRCAGRTGCKTQDAGRIGRRAQVVGCRLYRPQASRLYRLQGAGCTVHGSGCTVHGAGCRVHGARCTVQNIQATGLYRVQSAWCRVHGAWCMV